MTMNWKLAGAILALTTAGAVAQTNTNLNFWVQGLKVSLAGSTRGVFNTNGMIAGTHAVPVKLSSADIIRALDHHAAFTIGRAFTNWTVVTTNFMPGPDLHVTNHYEAAYPVHETVVYPAYSPRARLMLLQPLGPASFVGPLVVIRDGVPTVDYAVDNYFRVNDLGLAGRPEAPVATGKYDLIHNLVSTTEYSVKEFVFDATAFSGIPQSTFFAVQGFTTERVQSVYHGTSVVDRTVVKSMGSSVSGTGQIGPQGGFCVLRGNVSVEGGALETW